MRKQRLESIPLRVNFLSVILMLIFFVAGLWISFRWGVAGGAVYLLLWAASYPILFAGACRHCAYYGTRCPVPLEGSCVHHLFKKVDDGFGWQSLVWAGFAYLLRVCIPVWIIFSEPLPKSGVLYGGIFLLFWIVHFTVSGCPGCVNDQCPINPDYQKT